MVRVRPKRWVFEVRSLRCTSSRASPLPQGVAQVDHAFSELPLFIPSGAATPRSRWPTQRTRDALMCFHCAADAGRAAAHFVLHHFRSPGPPPTFPRHRAAAQFVFLPFPPPRAAAQFVLYHFRGTRPPPRAAAQFVFYHFRGTRPPPSLYFTASEAQDRRPLSTLPFPKPRFAAQFVLCHFRAPTPPPSLYFTISDAQGGAPLVHFHFRAPVPPPILYCPISEAQGRRPVCTLPFPPPKVAAHFVLDHFRGTGPPPSLY